MGFGHGGEMRKPLAEIAMLARLHETEMPLGQRKIGVARDGAEDGNAERIDGVGHEPPMSLAADAIEHDAADYDLRVVSDEAAHQRRRRLRLPRHVDDEQHRQSKSRGKVCRRAAAAWRTLDAVEQAHGALDDEKIGARPAPLHQRIDQLGRHRPAVEIEALPSRGGLMESGVDIVGPHLRRLYRQPAAPERREDRQRHGRLAGRRAGGRDDEAGRGHGVRFCP